MECDEVGLSICTGSSILYLPFLYPIFTTGWRQGQSGKSPWKKAVILSPYILHTFLLRMLYILKKKKTLPNKSPKLHCKGKRMLNRPHFVSRFDCVSEFVLRSSTVQIYPWTSSQNIPTTMFRKVLWHYIVTNVSVCMFYVCTHTLYKQGKPLHSPPLHCYVLVDRIFSFLSVQALPVAQYRSPMAWFQQMQTYHTWIFRNW